MGEVLRQIYEFVEKKGGLKARMQLVERTGIAKDKAAIVEEEEEIVRGFKALAAELTGQSFDDYMRFLKK
jgi:hypothetical protein